MDDSLKNWHRQDFYTFNAASDSQVILKSWNSNEYDVKEQRQPCQVCLNCILNILLLCVIGCLV